MKKPAPSILKVLAVVCNAESICYADVLSYFYLGVPPPACPESIIEVVKILSFGKVSRLVGMDGPAALQQMPQSLTQMSPFKIEPLTKILKLGEFVPHPMRDFIKYNFFDALGAVFDHPEKYHFKYLSKLKIII